MMINRILTICAAAALGAAGTSLAHAQQGYPQQQGYPSNSAPTGPSYSTAPSPYPPPGPGYGSDRRPADYDTLFEGPDDDDGPDGQAATALPPPGPVLSPNDPRYGRPMGAPAPTYSDRQLPTGPILSPDDPRYGRPSGPPVIYADRPPGQAPGYYDDRSMRPPESVGVAGGGNVTGAVPPQPGVGADGKPMTVAALPPEEQPDAGPAQLPPNLRRQEVSFVTKEPAGTIVVDTPNTYLYYVLGNGRAIRYGVRVGRDGFTWTGVQKISRKAEWPDWYPPTEMIERQPYLPRFMAGGPGNPLGARAMYLGSTVYRIHGTNQPSTIGKFVSSGCIGMLNEDVSDLFDRAKVGTRVVVLPGGPAPGTATASAAPLPGGPSAAMPPQAQAAAPLPGTQPSAVAPLPAPVTIR